MPTIDPKTYERAFARALAYARSRTRGQASDLAEDLAQEAMLASFDPKRYPWKDDKPLEHHVVNVVRSLISDRRRAAKLREEPTRAAAAEEAMKRSAMPADASVRAADREARRDARHEWMLSQLDGLARDVYLLYTQEVFDAAQQADVLGKDPGAVYKARHRVAEVARLTPAVPDSSPELASLGDDGDGDDEKEAS